MPSETSSEVKNSLLKGWLQGEYIEIVGQVLEEAAHNDDAKWSFTPEVKVEMLPEDEREAATKMYAMVDNAASTEIEAAVEE